MDSQVHHLSADADTMSGEHLVQVNLVAALRDAVAEGKSASAVDEILDQLLEFTKAHFSSEEMLMRLYAYDGYDAHVIEHENAIERIEAVRARYRAGDQVLSLETVESMFRWILGHTQKYDRAFGQFLAALDRPGG